MKIWHLLLLLLYATAMGVGQILFKMVSARSPVLGSSFAQKIFFYLTDVYVITSFFLYGVLAIAWVWILGFIPLSRAYPFTFLSIAVAGLGGRFLFGESLGMPFYIGSALIVSGLFVLTIEM